MNVTLEKKDDLNAIITIQIEKADYEEKLNSQFREYRKKAKIPGFRPGTVPMGMVKQMIGKSVLFEEVNKLTSTGLYDYLKEQNIQVLIHYPRILPNTKAYEYLNSDMSEFPLSLKNEELIISLPVFPEMRDDEINYVVNSIKYFYGKAK